MNPELHEARTIAILRRPDQGGFLKGLVTYAAQQQNWQVLDCCFLPCQAAATSSRKIDGVILTSNFTSSKEKDQFEQGYQGPVVALGTDVRNSRADASVKDNLDDAIEAMYEHLREVGLCHFAFVGQEEFAPRVEWRKSLHKLVTKDKCDFHVFMFNSEQDFSALPPPPFVEQYNRAFRNWLTQAPKPIGIVCQSDAMAVYITSVIKLMSFDISGEVAIMATSNTVLCEISNPPLSSWDPPCEAMGYKAAQLLDQLIRKETLARTVEIVPGGEVVARQSTQQFSQTIQTAMHYIREHACEGITVEQVVSQTQNVSRVTFEKRFKEAVGQTPGEAIRKVKMDRAKELLSNSAISITKIAHNCGFESSSQFSSAFKRVVGSTPRDFRKIHRKQDGAREDRDGQF